MKTKFEQSQALHDELFNLWRDWDERGGYEEFLYLCNFTSNAETPRVEQEIQYFELLIKEFKTTGNWEKLAN
ncbi:hypothetical protein M5040_06830 [Neisseria meningitidis]|nr:hypothetical protein [Neisseria meningitidis]